jgi:hypothetical protein
MNFKNFNNFKEFTSGPVPLPDEAPLSDEKGQATGEDGYSTVRRLSSVACPGDAEEAAHRFHEFGN